MQLDEILKRMETGEETTKTASAPGADDSQAALDAALDKTAAPAEPAPESPDAVATLMKTANELAATEKEAELAHSHLLGQAFADGAIAKFAQFDAQVRDAVPQTGQAQAPVNPLQKMAAEYNQGHDAALQQVHDTAAEEFLKGAEEVNLLVRHAAAQQQAQ